MKDQEKNAEGRPNRTGPSRGGGKIICCFDEVETKLLFRLVRYALDESLPPLDLFESRGGDDLVEKMREFLWSLARAREVERAADRGESSYGHAHP